MPVCVKSFIFIHVTAQQCQTIINKLWLERNWLTISRELCEDCVAEVQTTHKLLMITINVSICISRWRFTALRMVNGLQSSPCAPSFRDHALLLLISTLQSTAVTRGGMSVSETSSVKGNKAVNCSLSGLQLVMSHTTQSRASSPTHSSFSFGIF